VQVINPMLVVGELLCVGHSSAASASSKTGVEKKVRRHMLRARKRKGFGWTGGVALLYETLKLFQQLSGSRPGESRPGRIGPISLGAKQTGERRAGNPHAAFDVAGLERGMVEML